MRSLVARISSIVVVGVFVAASSAGAAESLEAAVAKTRRELESLKIQLRLYRQVEYPRQLRELDAAIRLTQAEIDVLEDRVRDYKRAKDTRSPGLRRESLEKAELSLLEAQLRLNNFVQERLAVRRSFSDCCRLAELEIAAVRARLAELERLRLADSQ